MKLTEPGWKLSPKIPRSDTNSRKISRKITLTCSINLPPLLTEITVFWRQGHLSHELVPPSPDHQKIPLDLQFENQWEVTPRDEREPPTERQPRKSIIRYIFRTVALAIVPAAIRVHMLEIQLHVAPLSCPPGEVNLQVDVQDVVVAAVQFDPLEVAECGVFRTASHAQCGEHDVAVGRGFQVKTLNVSCSYLEEG